MHLPEARYQGDVRLIADPDNYGASRVNIQDSRKDIGVFCKTSDGRVGESGINMPGKRRGKGDGMIRGRSKVGRMAEIGMFLFLQQKATEESLERGSPDYHGVDDMAILPPLLGQRLMLF